MTTRKPSRPSRVRRTFAIAIAAARTKPLRLLGAWPLFLLIAGLASVAGGIAQEFSVAWAAIVVGTCAIVLALSEAF